MFGTIFMKNMIPARDSKQCGGVGESYMIMLKRRTDPKTGSHASCEPARSKYTGTFHKSHFMGKFTSKMPQAKTADHTLCEPAQSKCT